MASSIDKRFWTEEKCLKLVSEYKSRPVLWDSSHKQFYWPHIKLGAWEGIGMALGVPAEKCKSKMSVLLSSLRREKCRLRKVLLKDPNGESKSRWFAFDALSFMLDRTGYKKRLRESTGESESEASHSNKKVASDNNKPSTPTIQITGPQGHTKIEKDLSSAIKTEATSDSEDQILQPGPSGNSKTLTNVPLKKRYSCDEMEEIETFTRFIQTKIKKYSPATRNAVQKAICDVIFKADQNYYDSIPDNVNAVSGSDEYQKGIVNVKQEIDYDGSD